MTSILFNIVIRYTEQCIEKWKIFSWVDRFTRKDFHKYYNDSLTLLFKQIIIQYWIFLEHLQFLNEMLVHPNMHRASIFIRAVIHFITKRIHLMDAHLSFFWRVAPATPNHINWFGHFNPLV